MQVMLGCVSLGFGAGLHRALGRLKLFNARGGGVGGRQNTRPRIAPEVHLLIVPKQPLVGLPQLVAHAGDGLREAE